MTARPRRAARLAELVVAILLCLYPRRFRGRFGRDILASVREELQAAADIGARALASAAVREVGNALGGLIPQHRLEWARHDPRSFGERLRHLLGALTSDVRYAVRSLVKAPQFTAVALVVLTLGIGATTAIFSVVDAVVLRGLPYDEHDRLVAVLEHDPTSPTTFANGATTIQNFLDWRERQRSFDAIAAVQSWLFRARNERGEPSEARAERVTHEFLSILRVPPLHGRDFTAEDEIDGRHRVVLLTHAAWQRWYGGDPAAVGRTIDLAGDPWQIVGVLPATFQYPAGSPDRADLIVPLPLRAGDRVRGTSRNYNYLTIGRLKPDVSIRQATNRLGRIAASLDRQYPDWYKGRRARVVPLQEHLVGGVRTWMLMLLGGVTFVMLIACANVANLMLARAAARGREMEVRAALGAGRLRLVRALLAESLVLSFAGTALGVVVGWAGVQGLRAWMPPGVPRVADIAVDWRVLAIASLAAVITGALFGIAPALQSSRPDLTVALKAGGRANTASRRRQDLRSVLVVSEVALATVLVVGAGLFLASFVKLVTVDFGFDYRRVLTVNLGASFHPSAAEGSVERRRAKTQAMIEAVRRLPAITSVGAAAGGVPLTGSWSRMRVALPGLGELAGEGDTIDVRAVTPGYLETLGVPLRAGRHLHSSDRATTERVIVINEAAAAKYWPGQEALGQRITIAHEERRVVGIVGNLRHLGPEHPVRQECYAPLDQSEIDTVSLVIRTAGNPHLVLPLVQEAIWSVDPAQRLNPDKLTLEDYLDGLIAQRRFNMTVLALFGVLGLVISAAGIYGVIAYVVSQRTSEFGLRMALGATPGAVIGLVLRRALVLVLMGLTIGITTARLLSRTVEAFLFQVGAADPGVFAAALLVLAFTGVLASVLPAMRAARVDPVVALRAE